MVMTQIGLVLGKVMLEPCVCGRTEQEIQVIMFCFLYFTKPRTLREF